MWSKIDDRYHSHPKTIALSLAARGLWVTALSYCGDHLTDGELTPEWLEAQVPATRKRTKLLDELLDVVAFEWDGNALLVHDYLDFNPSRKDVEGASELRSGAARKAANARWSK